MHWLLSPQFPGRWQPEGSCAPRGSPQPSLPMLKTRQALPASPSRFVRVRAMGGVLDGVASSISSPPFPAAHPGGLPVEP